MEGLRVVFPRAIRLECRLSGWLRKTAWGRLRTSSSQTLAPMAWWTRATCSTWAATGGRPMHGPCANLQRNNVQWLDANGDGVLDARDPVFAAVKLYMDINSDGVMQDGEGQDLGVYQLAANDRFWRTYA